MARYHYRLLNVFTLPNQALTGNPLCVFEDARGLDDSTMQALALQFNLSETTFILPSDVASARVRIFTPSFEMPFAGHPTLGTAEVVRALKQTGDALTLEMRAGVIAVNSQAGEWRLQAGVPRIRPVSASQEQLAQMLGLAAHEIGEACWVNTGSEQLIVPLTSVAAVDRCQPRLALLHQHARLTDTRFLVYVFARQGGTVQARFFFAKGNAVVEDPATGSACANLGGWLLTHAEPLPVTLDVYQGQAVGRPSRLQLIIDASSNLFVAGHVIELGRGHVEL